MELTPDQLKHFKTMEAKRQAFIKKHGYLGTTEELFDDMPKKEAVELITETKRVLGQRYTPDGKIIEKKVSTDQEDNLLKRYEVKNARKNKSIRQQRHRSW